MVALDLDRFELGIVDQDVLALGVFVALALVLGLDRLAGDLVDELLAQPIASLLVDLPESDPFARRGGGVKRDLARNQGQLEIALPIGASGRHARLLRNAKGANLNLSRQESINLQFRRKGFLIRSLTRRAFASGEAAALSAGAPPPLRGKGTERASCEGAASARAAEASPHLMTVRRQFRNGMSRREMAYLRGRSTDSKHPNEPRSPDGRQGFPNLYFRELGNFKGLQGQKFGKDFPVGPRLAAPNSGAIRSS